MTNNKTNFIRTRQHGRIHPLMATAAVAVTLVSLVGIAAITGILPTSQGTSAPVAAMPGQMPLVAASNGLQDTRTAQNTTAVVTPAPNYAPVPAPVPKPVVKHTTPHHTAPVRSDSQNYSQDNQQVAQGPAICSNCGRVESVVALQEPAKASGVGIAAGAVLGGILGNQVGSGNGRTLATVAGAVAGGYGGNEVEKRTRTTTHYQVRVRMEDGNVRTFPQQGADGWRVGDRVRVVDGALTSRG